MPGPPPPPPPVCAPPPAFNLAPSKGDSHGALLQSIRKGTTLKKTVTNDRSAPLVGGSQVSTSNNNKSSSSSSSTSIPNGVGLGGLFAGGMPKLKPVGKQSGGVNISNTYTNNGNTDSDVHSSKISGQMRLQTNLQRNFSVAQNDVQSALKKQMASHSNRNRGPPPPAPIRNISQSIEQLHDSEKQVYHSRNGSSNGLHLSTSSTLHISSSSPHQSPTSTSPRCSILNPNSSTLHRKANSSANLTVYDITDSLNNSSSAVPSRKPNLAPKPPVLNGKPAAPAKKLIVNGRPSSLYRAQSMKSPRTPSPQSPADEFNFVSKFGTVRNISAVLDKSLGPKARPTINSRPTDPPPMAPLQQTSSLPHLPNKLSIVKPPSQAPPPPPNFAPQPHPHAPPPPHAHAPPPPHAHAPPPPPQRGHYQAPVRTPPAVPSSHAPPPPPRHSSMRDLNGSRGSLDLDYKFRNEFHPVSEFPQPGSYRALSKLYTNQQESVC